MESEIVTQYVTESEYSEIPEVCCKILFVHAILLFMGVVVEYPITLHVDKIGAIVLSGNTLVYQWRKHIYVRHHFIYDYVEYEKFKIKIFCSEENLVYPFTKKLSNGPFEFITSRYVHCEKDLKISPSIFKSRGSKSPQIIE